jgi:Ca2+-binding RTX toxin-like protein
MPTTKMRSIRVQNDVLRGQAYRDVADFTVTVPFAAANLTGATSGFFVFVAPAKCHFLGADVVWGTAGTNTFRIKKVLAAATSAAGAAADANNVDMTAALAATGTANVVQSMAPVTTAASSAATPAHVLLPGDKVAIASAAGVATLAGGLIALRFAYV